MKSPKKQIAEDFEALDPKIVGRVKRVKDDPELVKLGDYIRKLEAKNDKLKESVLHTMNRPSEPGEKLDFESTAKKIIAGDIEALDEIAVDPKRTNRETAISRRDALEKIIEELRERRRQLWEKAIRENCESVRDISENFQAELLDALEVVQRLLERNSSWWQLLSRNGLQQDYRPAGWLATGYEKFLLFAGNGYSTLGHFIQESKKVWKID